MPEVSDVDLMALADGTLAEPRRGLVEAELVRCPELQQRLDVYRATGNTLARLFDPVMEAPVPPGLLRALQDPGLPQAPRAVHLAAGTAPASGRRRLVDALIPNGWSFSPGLAWATAVVAVIGLGVAIWDMRTDNSDGLGIAPFSQALETTPSGQRASLALADRGAGGIRPDLSFRHVDGRHCRQYEVAFATGRGLAGYACRVGSGRWRVEKEIATAVGNADQPGVIRPAGPSADVKAVDDAVGEVIRGDPLEASAELELIGRGWPPESH